MLLNAVSMALVGAALARRLGVPGMLATGLGGGTIGQITASIADPAGFVSGASQAVMALSGATLVVGGARRGDTWLAVAAVVAAGALDLVVADGRGLKPGHIAALLARIVAGFGQRTWSRSRNAL